jgi:hypothetical protein
MNRRRFHIPVSRTIVVASALVCFAGAIALMPSDVRSQLESRSHEIRAGESDTQAAPPVAVAPAVDAFEPRADEGDAPSSQPFPLASRAATNAEPRDAVRVTAIATGTHPTALVETGNGVLTVSIGDTLRGSRVATISEDGVRLLSGERFPLTPETTP